MKLSHVILLYIIGAVMLVFIKEARASHCTDTVRANYPGLAKELKVKTMHKRPVNPIQILNYCTCIELIESNNRIVTSLEVLQCAGMANLFYTISV